MEEQQPPPDDFPMMDAPEPLISANTSASSSSAQRFSIVDVLGSDAGIGSGNKDIGPLPDPLHSDMHECDEAKVLQRLQELYPHTDIQKLPRHWNKHDRWTAPAVQNNNGMTQMPALELSSDFLRVTKRKGSSQNSKDAAAVRANRPIPRSCIVYYFEITVVSKGHDGYMGVGLSEKNVSLNRLPGWDQTSYGYHGDDGYFFASSGKGVEYGPTFTTRDVIGCGLNFVTREIFFTKNGQHLGVANSQQPIPLCNELYPTVGMQTADEMIDANFGQKPFMFNIRRELEAAEAATLASVASIDLPSEKVLWMNSLISNWMAHEGYSRALDALNRATGGGGQKLEQSAPALAKSESQGSTSTSTASKDSQSPAAAAEKVAETVMRSMIGLLGGGGESATGGGARRSVVRSVQEALYEELEQRRTVVRMVKRGQLAEAIERLDQIYPNLLDSNRQLALLLKTQYFVEMIRETSRELPPLPQDLEPLASTPRPNSHHQFAHSPSPRPSSSRGGKRSASAVDEEDAIAGTSCSGLAANQHNPVKRRSSDEECTVITQQQSMPTHLGHRQHQNGNSVTSAQQQQPEEEFMEVGDDSQDGQSALAGPGDCLLAVANGRSNGCSLLVGTPPTSTTIIDEPVADISVSTDRLLMDMGDEKEEPDCGGFANAEEQSQFEKYTSILLFGQQISQFSLNLDIEDGQVPQNCAALRQRMNEAFSLICYRDPSQSEHSYLLDQCQRDLVAKALNAAILESHGKEGISPLDKCLRRARFIREQALAYSASAIFADANRLLFGENPAASPSHSNQEMNDDESLAATAAEGTNGQEKSSPKLKRQADAQKKEM